MTVLSEMKKDLDRKLRGLLLFEKTIENELFPDILEKSPRENSTRAMKMTQIYYDSCMDEVSQNEMVRRIYTSTNGFGKEEADRNIQRNCYF